MKPKLNNEWKRVLVVLLLMPLSACSLSHLNGGAKPSSDSRNNSSKTTTPFSPSSDARKDLLDALNRLNTAYPYRLTETAIAGANGQKGYESTRVVEFAAANRSHMKWTGGPGGDIEAISIADKHYWFSNGKWTEGTIPSSLGPRGEDFAKKLAEMVREVTYVGPETVNGLSCFAYTGRFEHVMGGQKWSGTAKIWIGAADGLIHQSDSEFHVSSYGTKSHTVYEYDVNVRIEPPM
jgi:hypothetical protein